MNNTLSEAFILNHSKLMLQSIIRKICNWDDAREIVQDCWLKFFTNFKNNKYPDDVPHEAILFQLLKFESYNFIKKKMRRRKKLIVDSRLVDQDNYAVSLVDHDKKLLFKERKSKIKNHLANNAGKFDLSESITILQSLKNKDNTEIAQALNITPEEVAKRKYMAKEKLKYHFRKKEKNLKTGFGSR